MAKIYQNSNGNKFLFFTNYKVMNSYLAILLKTNFPEIKVFTSPDRLNNIEQYLKLSIVRNPYDRLLSLYFDKCKAHPQRVRTRTSNIFLQRSQHQILSTYSRIYNKKSEIVEAGKEITLDTPEYLIFDNNLKILESISFNEFIKITMDIFSSPEKMDAHFFPQTKIMTINNEFVVNLIFRLEEINNEWTKVCNILGIDVELEYGINRTNFEGPNKYKRFYTLETKQIVYSLYKKDFDYLGYSK